jgi:hypothetical protein
MQPKPASGLEQLDTPKIQSIPDPQSFLVAPSASHSNTSKQQIYKTSYRPQPVSVVPASATADSADWRKSLLDRNRDDHCSRIDQS